MGYVIIFLLISQPLHSASRAQIGPLHLKIKYWKFAPAARQAAVIIKSRSLSVYLCVFVVTLNPLRQQTSHNVARLLAIALIEFWKNSTSLFLWGRPPKMKTTPKERWSQNEDNIIDEDDFFTDVINPHKEIMYIHGTFLLLWQWIIGTEARD